MLPTHPVEELLWDIDQAWQAQDAQRLRLRIVGSSALFLQTDYRRGTKDSDVLETAELRVEARQQLLALAGKGAPLHRRHGMYVEILASGEGSNAPVQRGDFGIAARGAGGDGVGGVVPRRTLLDSRAVRVYVFCGGFR